MKINSPEFSQMQRERIYKTKPWLKSTGAKTVQGKEISKMNALKIDSHLYNLMKAMDDIKKQQKDIFSIVNNKTTIDLKRLD